MDLVSKNIGQVGDLVLVLHRHATEILSVRVRGVCPDGDVSTRTLLNCRAQDVVSARVTPGCDVRRCDDVQEGCVVAAFLADVSVEVDDRHAREPR
jgi:hypothetical protein